MDRSNPGRRRPLLKADSAEAVYLDVSASASLTPEPLYESEPDERGDRRAAQRAARSLAATVAKLHGAMPLPVAAQRLLSATQSTEYKLGGVVRIIESDPALAARIMRQATSALLGRVRCTSIAQAVTRLGARMLQATAIAACAIELFGHDEPSAQLVVRHANTTAAIARFLSRHCGLVPEEMYTCGLLHDIGKLMLLRGADLDYHELLDRTTGPDLVHLVERERYGFDHALVAGHVLTSWKLPHPLPRVVAWHHQPRRAYRATGQLSRMVALVRVADQLAYAAVSPNLEGSESQLPPLAQELEILGLPDESFHALYQALADEIEQQSADASEPSSQSRVRESGAQDLAPARPTPGQPQPPQLPAMRAAPSADDSDPSTDLRRPLTATKPRRAKAADRSGRGKREGVRTRGAGARQRAESATEPAGAGPVASPTATAIENAIVEALTTDEFEGQGDGLAASHHEANSAEAAAPVDEAAASQTAFPFREALSGGVDDEALAGGVDDETLAGGVDDEALAGGVDDETLAGGVDDEALAGGVDDETLAGGVDDEALAGGVDDETLAGAESDSWARGAESAEFPRSVRPNDSPLTLSSDQDAALFGSEGLAPESEELSDVFAPRSGAPRNHESAEPRSDGFAPMGAEGDESLAGAGPSAKARGTKPAAGTVSDDEETAEQIEQALSGSFAAAAVGFASTSPPEAMPPSNGEALLEASGSEGPEEEETSPESSPFEEPTIGAEGSESRFGEAPTEDGAPGPAEGWPEPPLRASSAPRESSSSFEKAAAPALVDGDRAAIDAWFSSGKSRSGEPKSTESTSASSATTPGPEARPASPEHNPLPAADPSADASTFDARYVYALCGAAFFVGSAAGRFAAILSDNVPKFLAFAMLLGSIPSAVNWALDRTRRGPP